MTLSQRAPAPRYASEWSPARLNKNEWVVRDVAAIRARSLVQDFHYAKDYAGTTIAIHGLMRRDESAMSRVYGAAMWGSAVFAIRRFGCLPLLLSRLVVAPDVPSNAASFLMSHSMRLIDRSVWPVLLTYADTSQGHTGAIYRATGWEYDGTGGGWNYYSPDGVQRSSLGPDGHFLPCPEGWEARKTVKHRFVHRAVAASSDAPAFQAGEGSSQLTLSLHTPDVSA